VVVGGEGAVLVGGVLMVEVVEVVGGGIPVVMEVVVVGSMPEASMVR